MESLGSVIAIMLDASGAQAWHAVLFDEALPGDEFLDGKRIAPARILERDKAGTDAGDDDRLATCDPAFGVRRRQIGLGQRCEPPLDLRFHPVSLARIGHDSMLSLVECPVVLEL